MDEATLAQTEKLACTQILEFAKTFYQNPDNLKAFEAWKRNKEEVPNVSRSQDHLRSQSGEF